MAEIRPLRSDEIDQVAELYRFVDRSDWRIPPAEVAPWLRRTLLDHPWADPDIPTLVYVDGGEIMGFIGSHVRRMCFDGRPMRTAAAGPLIAHPDVRSRGVGAQLWRHYLAGPQELTVTDGASDEMRAIFELIGGQMMHPSCLAWARVFRPWAFGGDRILHSTVMLRERVKPRARGAWRALDRVTRPRVPYFAPHGEPPTTREELTPALVLEHLPAMTRSVRLHPDYDERFLEWLFAELHHNRTWGEPVRRLVRDAGGRAIGWYVYFLDRGGPSQVVQVAARDHRVGAVLDDLFADADSRGATALVGRVEPRLLTGLAHRGAMYRYSPRALVHAQDDELLGVITSGRALLSRLDAEWWMAT